MLSSLVCEKTVLIGGKNKKRENIFLIFSKTTFLELGRFHFQVFNFLPFYFHSIQKIFFSIFHFIFHSILPYQVKFRPEATCNLYCIFATLSSMLARRNERTSGLFCHYIINTLKHNTKLKLGLNY